MPGDLDKNLADYYVNAFRQIDLDSLTNIADNTLDNQPEELTMNEDIIQQDKDDVSSALQVEQVAGRTHVSIVVLDQPADGRCGHKVRKVRCYHGSAFTQGYPYDQNSDSYLISCMESYHLGYVPVAFQLTVPGTQWTIPIPLPESVVLRHLTDSQNIEMKAMRKKWVEKDERYKIMLVQMSGCEV